MRGTAGACVVVALALGGPMTGLGAQGTTVGVVVGGVRTSQIWTPATDADDVTGLLAGAYADVPTSVSGLSIRAEGAYTRRGGDVMLEVSGQPMPGRLRVDHLTVSVHLALSRSLGPVQAHVALGPTLDQVLRSRLDPFLVQLLDDQKAVVFGVAVGGGLGAWVGERLYLGAEVRHVEGLGDAHSGNFVTVRNRSLELLLRAGIPMSVLRGR